MPKFFGISKVWIGIYRINGLLDSINPQNPIINPENPLIPQIQILNPANPDQSWLDLSDYGKTHFTQGNTRFRTCRDG